MDVPLCHFAGELTLPQNNFVWLISHSIGDLKRAALTIFYWIFFPWKSHWIYCWKLQGTMENSVENRMFWYWYSFVSNVMNESMRFGCIANFCAHTRLCSKASEYCCLLGKDWGEQHSSQLEILELNYWST